MTEHTAVDSHVQQVAALLPFSVQLEADMGGAFALQIDLGRRGGVDDPDDTAGIDPDDVPTPRWWVDIEGGERTYIPDLGLDADPQPLELPLGMVESGETVVPGRLKHDHFAHRTMIADSAAALRQLVNLDSADA